jgi:DsbC/DsbD-like thiol-disulfide interchange protein
MQRRTFILGVAALGSLSSTAVSAQQWQSRLLNGGMDNGQYRLGLHIHLAEGWKTYWRVPGVGGVPPTISFEGANMRSFSVTHPVPVRHRDGSGESIGYDTDVVFPVTLQPENPKKPVRALMKAFIGVCEDICIPVQLEAEQALLPGIRKPQDLALIKTWDSKVPKPTNDFVSVLKLEGTTLVAALSGPAIDIFVEPLADHSHHFKAPVLSGKSAQLHIVGGKPLESLRGTKVRLTIVTASENLEQTLVVS